MENKFIDTETYKKLKNKNIFLKKIKKVFLEDAQYYIEDVRKDIIEKLSYEKVYKQGFNINTPINLKLQKIATTSLRDGLINYDRRKGWRGPLSNKNYSAKWFSDLEKYNLEKSINWKVSIVKKVNKFSAIIETQDKIEGIIEYKDISWTKKEFDEILKTGDIIYTKKIKDNKFSLKQIPKINGGIVVMDPYTGRVGIKRRF